MPRRTRSVKTDSRSARAELQQRREPYWARVASRCALGYRKGKTDGTWIARSQDPDGKKHYKSVGKADDLLDADGVGVLSFDQAQDKTREWFKQKAQREAGLDEELTVQGAVEDYLSYLRREKAATTAYVAEKRASKHILAAMGEIDVTNLTPRLIQRWLEGLVKDTDDPESRRRSMDSANHCLVILKAALNRAYIQSRVQSDDAWRRIKPFKGTTAARKIFLTETQAQRLLNACHDPALRDLVTAGLLTGARFGEIAAMRVRDLDLSDAIWNVAVGKTGQRVTVLTADGARLLKRVVMGKRPQDLVFSRSDDVVWDRHNIRKPFSAAIKRASLDPEASYYCLRHTCISLALKHSVPAQVVAENTGTSVRMIERHYGKFLRADKQAMLERGALAVEMETDKKLVSLEHA